MSGDYVKPCNIAAFHQRTTSVRILPAVLRMGLAAPESEDNEEPADAAMRTLGLIRGSGNGDRQRHQALWREYQDEDGTTAYNRSIERVLRTWGGQLRWANVPLHEKVNLILTAKSENMRTENDETKMIVELSSFAVVLPNTKPNRVQGSRDSFVECTVHHGSPQASPFESSQGVDSFDLQRSLPHVLALSLPQIQLQVPSEVPVSVSQKEERLRVHEFLQEHIRCECLTHI